MGLYLSECIFLLRVNLPSSGIELSRSSDKGLSETTFTLSSVYIVRNSASQLGHGWNEMISFECLGEITLKQES